MRALRRRYGRARSETPVHIVLEAPSTPTSPWSGLVVRGGTAASSFSDGTPIAGGNFGSRALFDTWARTYYPGATVVKGRISPRPRKRR